MFRSADEANLSTNDVVSCKKHWEDSIYWAQHLTDNVNSNESKEEEAHRHDHPNNKEHNDDHEISAQEVKFAMEDEFEQHYANTDKLSGEELRSLRTYFSYEKETIYGVIIEKMLERSEIFDAVNAVDARQDVLDLDEAETLNRVKLESSMRGETILTKAASSAPLYAVMNLISYGASISKTNAVARASRRVSESSSSEANLTNKEERKEKEQSGTVEALIVERYLKAAEESATGYKKGLNCSENRLQRLRDLQVNAKRLKKQLNLEVSEYTNRERARQY